MDKKCFIICPIGKEDSETRKRSDKVLNHLLKPVCEGLGYDLIRSDKIASAGKIDIEILNYLDSAELAIADLTDLNPNVFYEVGYREAKSLPCVQIALEGTELPFDRSTYRTHFYSLSDLDKVEEFKTVLEKVVQSIESRDTISAATANTSKSTENVSYDSAVESTYSSSNQKDIHNLKEDTMDVVFYVYDDSDLDFSENKFSIKMTYFDIFRTIGYDLLEKVNLHQINMALNNYGLQHYFSMKKTCDLEKSFTEYSYIDISGECLRDILIIFSSRKFITSCEYELRNGNETSKQHQYKLTELGRTLLMQISKQSQE